MLRQPSINYMNVLFLNKAFMVKHSQEVFLENSDCPGCILFIILMLNWKKKSLAEWFKKKKERCITVVLMDCGAVRLSFIGSRYVSLWSG